MSSLSRKLHVSLVSILLAASGDIISSTFLTPAGGTVNAEAWSLDDSVECRATSLYLQRVRK